MTDPTADITPAPAPMSAEAMLLALLKTNAADRIVTQEALDHLTQEAARLDAIRDGLNAALKAVRFPRSAAAASA
jgi:hypothetical protein